MDSPNWDWGIFWISVRVSSKYYGGLNYFGQTLLTYICLKSASTCFPEVLECSLDGNALRQERQTKNFYFFIESPYFNNFKIRAKVFQKLEHCCDRVIRYQLAMKGPKTILDKEAFGWRFKFWLGWNCTRRACSCIFRWTVCWLSSFLHFPRHPSSF